MNVNLYSLLPDTLDAQRAKELTDAQSEVRSRQMWPRRSTSSMKHDVPESDSSSFIVQVKYREASKKQASTALYHLLPETLETQHAKEASQLQSQVRLNCSAATSETAKFRILVHA